MACLSDVFWQALEETAGYPRPDVESFNMDPFNSSHRQIATMRRLRRKRMNTHKVQAVDPLDEEDKATMLEAADSTLRIAEFENRMTTLFVTFGRSKESVTWFNGKKTNAETVEHAIRKTFRLLADMTVGSEGGILPENKQGNYLPDPKKECDSRPVYKMSAGGPGGKKQYIYHLDSGFWVIHDKAGAKEGYTCRVEDNAQAPNMVEGKWEAYDGKKWVEEPALTVEPSKREGIVLRDVLTRELVAISTKLRNNLKVELVLESEVKDKPAANAGVQLMPSAVSGHGWSDEAEHAGQMPRDMTCEEVMCVFRTLRLPRTNVEHIDAMNFVNLVELDISGNQCSSLYVPRNLQVLNAYNCGMGHLPEESLPDSLYHIGLGYNFMTSAAQIVYFCPNLLSLDLSFNGLCDLPETLELFKPPNMTQLKHLFLYGNPIALLEGYRESFLTTVPSLEVFDNETINPNERDEMVPPEGVAALVKVNIEISSLDGIPKPAGDASASPDPGGRPSSKAGKGKKGAEPEAPAGPTNIFYYAEFNLPTSEIVFQTEKLLWSPSIAVDLAHTIEFLPSIDVRNELLFTGVTFDVYEETRTPVPVDPDAVVPAAEEGDEDMPKPKKAPEECTEPTECGVTMTIDFESELERDAVGAYALGKETCNSKPVYECQSAEVYLYYLESGFWVIGPNTGAEDGYTCRVESQAATPDKPAATPEGGPVEWQILDGQEEDPENPENLVDKWTAEPSFSVQINAVVKVATIKCDLTGFLEPYSTTEGNAGHTAGGKAPLELEKGFELAASAAASAASVASEASPTKGKGSRPSSKQSNRGGDEAPPAPVVPQMVFKLDLNYKPPPKPPTPPPEEPPPTPSKGKKKK